MGDNDWLSIPTCRHRVGAMMSHIGAPVVHLVLVDDDQEDWLPWLEEAAREHLAKWKLLQRGLFQLEIHTCRSREGFQTTVRQLLDQGAPVYAAVDLILPQRDSDEVPDPDLWRGLIRWCIERLEEAEGRGNRFEFCVMSQDLSALRELYSDTQHGEALERHRVRKLDKTDIQQSVDPKAKLVALWEDVRTFILEQSDSFVFPDVTQASGEWSRLIWFGKDPRLCELRRHAERIAADPRGGLYLIFSDGSGYEEDWFHLVRHLRNADPRRWKVLALGRVRPFEDPEWARPFQEPPDDLLITGADRLAEQGLELGPILESSGFFEAIRSAGVKAFIQFPSASSGNALKLSLDPEEVVVFERCLDAVGVPSIEDLDQDLGHARNPRLLRFPRFSELKDAGVTRRIIEHEVDQCQRNLGMAGCPLDPELAYALAELPWHGHEAGLSDLRHAIRVAFRKAARDADSRARASSVGVEHFPIEEVKTAYDGPAGLEIRGRRLFDLLTERRSLLPVQEPSGSARLHGLEELLELYTGLRRLVDLQAKLEAQGLPTATDGFSTSHYQALHKAHEFLDQILGGPDYLADRTARFRRVVEDPALRHLADEAYPSLKARPDWRELVERIQFVWPFDTFPLPTSVSDYLRHSAVVPEFTPDFPSILRRYPRLAAEWDELETRRLELRQKLQARENERWLAECYVRESDAQPVCVLLSDGVTAPAEWPRAFECALRTFVYFNTYLAVCENHYVHNGSFLEPGQIKDVLDRIDLGPGLMLIESYVDRLDRAAQRKASVFSPWHDRWPAASRQQDAVRLAVKVASWLRKHDAIRDSDEEPIRCLAELSTESEACSVFKLLNMFRIVRNQAIKSGTLAPFWRDEGEDLWDLLRRFVTASIRSDLRIGFATSNGDPSILWQRRRPSDAGPALPGRLSMLGGTDPRPLFPIDDLVRVNPEDWSLWGVYSRGEDWVDLTLRNRERPKRKPGSATPWLPTKDVFRASALWSPVHA